MGDAAGQLADRFHLLCLPQLRVCRMLFGHIAADEEMPPDRLRPCPHPGQHHGLSIPVNIAGVEVAHDPAAPRRPHLFAGTVEIVGMDEFDRAVADHLFGPIANDRHRTRTDLNEISLGIGDQDEVLRSLEDALPLLDLLTERLLRSFALADVVRDLRRSDNFPR